MFANSSHKKKTFNDVSILLLTSPAREKFTINIDYFQQFIFLIKQTVNTKKTLSTSVEANRDNDMRIKHVPPNQLLPFHSRTKSLNILLLYQILCRSPQK